MEIERRNRRLQWREGGRRNRRLQWRERRIGGYNGDREKEYEATMETERRIGGYNGDREKE